MRTAAEKIPSADDLRRGLLAQLDEFAKLSGMTKSEIGKNAVNDVAFISDLEAGRNITLKLYDRVRSYIDNNWPDRSALRRGSQ
jgi:hypothetical protein